VGQSNALALLLTPQLELKGPLTSALNLTYISLRFFSSPTVRILTNPSTGGGLTTPAAAPPFGANLCPTDACSSSSPSFLSCVRSLVGESQV
jgi:hypothetical protein